MGRLRQWISVQVSAVPPPRRPVGFPIQYTDWDTHPAGSTLPTMAAARHSPQTTEVLEELARVERELVQFVISPLRHDPRWLEVALSAECQALLLQRTPPAQLVETLQPFLMTARDLPARALLDVALTRWAILQGWDDREIVALLMQYRHIQAAGGKDATAKRSHLVSPGSPAWPGYWRQVLQVGVRAARDAVFTTISRLLGVTVVLFGRSDTAPWHYSLVTPTGEQIVLGSATDLLHPTRCAARVYEARHHILPVYPPPQWRDLVRMLARYQERLPPPASPSVQMVRHWLHAYLQVAPPTPHPAEALGQHRPFTKKGKLWVRVEALQQFLAATGETEVTAPQLRVALRTAGFRGVRLTSRTPQGVKCRFYWRGNFPALAQS
jgi:hypothetical protein